MMNRTNGTFNGTSVRAAQQIHISDCISGDGSTYIAARNVCRIPICVHISIEQITTAAAAVVTGRVRASHVYMRHHIRLFIRFNDTFPIENANSGHSTHVYVETLEYFSDTLLLIWSLLRFLLSSSYERRLPRSHHRS